MASKKQAEKQESLQFTNDVAAETFFLSRIETPRWRDLSSRGQQKGCCHPSLASTFCPLKPTGPSPGPHVSRSIWGPRWSSAQSSVDRIWPKLSCFSVEDSKAFFSGSTPDESPAHVVELVGWGGEEGGCHFWWQNPHWTRHRLMLQCELERTWVRWPWLTLTVLLVVFFFWGF